MAGPELQLVESAPLRYLLSVPCGAAEGARPVLVFLHGYDEGAPMEIRLALTLHGPLRAGNPPVATEEFIVVAPQLPVRGDLWHGEAEAVQRITQQVQAEHGGDPRRTYLTGFSFGGNGVFDVALAQPGQWAALWAVDPTRVPRGDPGLPVWLSSGAVSRWRRAGFIRTLRLQEPGGGDAGDRVYEDQDQDHVGTATLAYRNEAIYRWLLARRLGE